MCSVGEGSNSQFPQRRRRRLYCEAPLNTECPVAALLSIPGATCSQTLRAPPDYRIFSSLIPEVWVREGRTCICPRLTPRRFTRGGLMGRLERE